MAFQIEALAAHEGDALLLHYGTAAQPKIMIIDGGPSGVYREVLAPRLKQLRGKTNKPLKVRLVVVSHMDGDHIEGIQELLAGLLDEDGSCLCQIDGLWHNAFEDVPKSKPAAAGPSVTEQQAAIIATIGQGQSLRDDADGLGIPMNNGGGLIQVTPRGTNTFDLGNGLTLTVLGPTAKRLEALRKEWDKYVKECGTKAAAAAVAASVAKKDASVFNLSSIAVLAECQKRTMLLAGDALGEDLLAGLKTAGKLNSDGKMHVDVFKLPHHGSKRNCSPELFKAIKARHYVVSTNGDKHKHPDLDTLKRLLASREDDDFSIEFTYKQDKLVTFFKAQEKAERHPRVVFRKDKNPSIMIDALS